MHRQGLQVPATHHDLERLVVPLASRGQESGLALDAGTDDRLSGLAQTHVVVRERVDGVAIQLHRQHPERFPRLPDGDGNERGRPPGRRIVLDTGGRRDHPQPGAMIDPRQLRAPVGASAQVGAKVRLAGDGEHHGARRVDQEGIVEAVLAGPALDARGVGSCDLAPGVAVQPGVLDCGSQVPQSVGHLARDGQRSHGLRVVLYGVGDAQGPAAQVRAQAGLQLLVQQAGRLSVGDQP